MNYMFILGSILFAPIGFFLGMKLAENCKWPQSKRLLVTGLLTVILFFAVEIYVGDIPCPF